MALNAMEGMIVSLVKALKLQPVLDLANRLAGDGTADKIKRMVDEWDETRELLREIRDELRARDRSSDQVRGQDIEPGSGSDVCDNRSGASHSIIANFDT